MSYLDRIANYSPEVRSADHVQNRQRDNQRSQQYDENHRDVRVTLVKIISYLIVFIGTNATSS